MGNVVDAKDIPLSKLAKMYIKIRTAMQEIQQEYDNKIGELEEQKQMISLAMKDQLLALNATNVKTEAGLVILSKKTKFYPGDWDAFSTWVKQHDALDLLERRVHQLNTKQYVDENSGEIPPGLTTDTQYIITVRKP